MSQAGTAALDLLVQTLPGKVGLHWVGPDGSVTRRIGFDDGAAIALAADRLRVVVPEARRHVLLGSTGAHQVVATWDAAVDAALGQAVHALGEWVLEAHQLEADIAAMSDSAAYYLEVISLIDETLPRLGSGESEAEIARMCLEQLVVAAGLERALFVRLPDGGGRAEVLVYVEMASHELRAIARQYPFDPQLPARAGLVGRAAQASDAGLMVRVGDADFCAEPDSPEALARQGAIAIPVRYGSGPAMRTLGVLLAIDRSRQGYGASAELGSEQHAFTNSVACMLGTVLGTRYVAELTKELETANEIQRQIRPACGVSLAGFDLAGGCATSGDVGGDYYDFVPAADGSLYALIADVSGHNLASGMVMVSARAALRVLAERTQRIDVMFAQLNRALHGDLVRTEKFITAAGLHLRPRDHRVQIANAGHLDTFVWRARTRSVERHSGTDPIFGFLPDATYALLELELAPGDTLVLITDGVTEAVSPEQEMFGEERLARWLERNADGSAGAILAGIFQAVADFTQGGRRADDISALVVKAG